MRVAFKPTSTIGQLQNTVTRDGKETELRGKGRHDPCVLPRAAPMVESMVALVLADALMQQKAQCDLLEFQVGLQRALAAGAEGGRRRGALGGCGVSFSLYATRRVVDPVGVLVASQIGASVIDILANSKIRLDSVKRMTKIQNTS